MNATTGVKTLTNSDHDKMASFGIRHLENHFVFMKNVFRFNWQYVRVGSDTGGRKHIRNKLLDDWLPFQWLWICQYCLTIYFYFEE